MSDKASIHLSKTLTWLLRHHVVDKGLKITSDGFVLIDDVLKLEEFKNYNFDDITKVVETNDKKRFDLKEDNGVHYIRANQGHSHEVASKIKQEELLTRLDKPLPLILHGTTYKALGEIKKSGLKKMGRSHIHFAINDDIVEGNKGQSGIRGNCQVMVYLNMEKAMNDGIEFFISSNNVVLSPGVGNDGIIDAKYIEKIIDRRTKKTILL